MLLITGVYSKDADCFVIFSKNRSSPRIQNAVNVISEQLSYYRLPHFNWSPECTDGLGNRTIIALKAWCLELLWMYLLFSVTTAGFRHLFVDWTCQLHWATSSLWSLICVHRCSGYRWERGALRWSKTNNFDLIWCCKHRIKRVD